MGLLFQWDRVEQTFADQFEREGENFRYRKWQKGEPILVTSDERDEFCNQFSKRIRYSGWGVGAGLVLLGVGVVLLLPGPQALDAPLYIGLAAILAAFMGFWLWAYNAPSRALARRTPVGRARTSNEMSRMRLKKATYGQMAAAVGGAVVLVWSQSRRHDLLTGWYRLWLVFLALIVLGCGIQAFRKWRIERNDD